MIFWIRTWELMAYGTFCLGGGLFIGWIWWGRTAPRKSKRVVKSHRR